MKNQIYSNNGMSIVIGETRTRSLNKYDMAYVEDTNRACRKFIVVNGLHIDHDNMTCYWDFAYAYDLTHDEATSMLDEKWHDYCKS